MSRNERAWLLGAVVIATTAILVAVMTGRRWSEARQKLDGGTRAQADAGLPSETAWAAVQARLAACRSRLPAAGTPASRQAQQTLLDLVQRLGLEVTEVMPKAGFDPAKVALSASPGWPAVVMELRGKAAFPAVTAILAKLPSLDTAVLPLEVELMRNGASPASSTAADPEAPAAAASPSEPADRRVQVRLVLAL